MLEEVAVRDQNLPEISDLQRVHKELERWRGKAFLLTPYARTTFESIKSGFRPEFRVTYISPDPADQQVYELDKRPDQLVLTKQGLQILDHLAGIKWIGTWNALEEKDPIHPYYCVIKAEGKVQDLDGEWRNSVCTATLDLRDDSATTKKMLVNSPDGKQLARARLNTKSQTETLAKNKVRRELLGLRGTFTRKELSEKPFVILKLNPVLDMSDPLIKKLVVMEQLGISSELYDRAAKDHIPPTTRIINVPAVEVIPPAAPTPKLDENRTRLIKSVEELYKKKVRGGRSPNKQPIAEIVTEELIELEKLLSVRPDITT
jgi:hypothetical protein